MGDYKKNKKKQRPKKVQVALGHYNKNCQTHMNIKISKYKK